MHYDFCCVIDNKNVPALVLTFIIVNLSCRVGCSALDGDALFLCLLS